jgi:hypothetical protein
MARPYTWLVREVINYSTSAGESKSHRKTKRHSIAGEERASLLEYFQVSSPCLFDKEWYENEGAGSSGLRQRPKNYDFLN